MNDNRKPRAIVGHHRFQDGDHHNLCDMVERMDLSSGYPSNTNTNANEAHPMDEFALNGVTKDLAIQEPKKNKFHDDVLCPFCRKNGETQKVYRSHSIRDDNGNITCPVLKRYTCPICGASGSKAHTLRHCPRAAAQQASRVLASDPMMSMQPMEYLTAPPNSPRNSPPPPYYEWSKPTPPPILWPTMNMTNMGYSMQRTV